MEKNQNAQQGAEVYDVTFEDIIASSLIPGLLPHDDLQYIGKGWYKHKTTGLGYFFLRNPDGTISVKETRQSKTKVKISKPTTPKVPKEPKEPHVTRVTIICLDCGANREINIQDKFQVKRCIPCQHLYRNLRRSERMKAKRIERAAQKTDGPVTG